MGDKIMDKTLFTINFKYFGMSVKWSDDADRNKVLHAIVWYPKSTKHLGHLYPAITFKVAR